MQEKNNEIDEIFKPMLCYIYICELVEKQPQHSITTSIRRNCPLTVNEKGLIFDINNNNLFLKANQNCFGKIMI